MRGNFHEIITLFQTVSLYDELLIERSNSRGVKFISEPELPWDFNNSLYRACFYLEKEIHESLSLKLALKKHIPFASGLGGGSADAATLLSALGKTFNLPFRVIYKIACKVGSDVPFLLVGGTAIGLGRGEKLIFPGDLQPYELELFFPPVGISTSEAYSLIDRGNHNESADLKKVFELYAALKNCEYTKAASISKNTFEKVICEAEILNRLKSLSGNQAIFNRLSGSGSTIFSLYKPGSGKGKYRFVSSDEVKRANGI
ncbi:hypothetical protein AT15_07165 [Kosmotoga arenicorallina S304]|uniref:4-diphosphocytidyl-2-C-methyl-D-erythritol kinase n=1 Tax=Kosmotoga arenicorallina S304 TaxID=1453497 RepID=A0A176K2H5_9BACT|nr:hypothetical protein AT15_07165 [Kosmotoga arenicorallina S304]